MKTLTLKPTKMLAPNRASNGKTPTYADIIREIVNSVPAATGSFTPSDIHKRARLLRALDDADGDMLALEDEDAKALKECVEHCRWRSADILALDQFLNDVEAL